MKNKKDKYKATWKVVGLYKNGRYYPKKQKTESGTFRNKTGRFGTEGMKKHLKKVYGSNLKSFRVKKL